MYIMLSIHLFRIRDKAAHSGATVPNDAERYIFVAYLDVMLTHREPLDVKGRFSTRLPYTLANSPAQLQSLHYGRQKSIEVRHDSILQT